MRSIVLGAHFASAILWFSQSFATARLCSDIFSRPSSINSVDSRNWSRFKSDFHQLLTAAKENKIMSAAQADRWAQKMAEFDSNTKRIKDPNAQIFLENWNLFHRTFAEHLNRIQSIPKKEQWLWTRKLKAPANFATAHFEAFLNHKNPEFDYNRMLTILEAVNQPGARTDLAFFIYAFEKEVRKFSSEQEFRNCR